MLCTIFLISVPWVQNTLYRGSFRKSKGRVHKIQEKVFWTGAQYTGEVFRDGCTLKLTAAHAAGAPALTEPLTYHSVVPLVRGEI